MSISRNPHIWLILLLLVACTACSSTMKLDKAQRSNLPTTRIGLIVLMPGRQVITTERLHYLPVIVTEARHHIHTIEGIWDPTPTLGEICGQTLQTDLRLPTIPLWSESDPAKYQKLVKDAEAAFLETAKNAKDRDTFFSAPLPDSLRATYAALGLDYVLELTIGSIAVVRVVGPQGQLYVRAIGRLFRVSDGAVVWWHNPDSTRVQDFGFTYVERIPDLEKDNLALLKQHYTEAVRNLCKENKSKLFQYLD